MLVPFVFSEETGRKDPPSARNQLCRLLPSMVTGILRTIKQTMIERRLGRMADAEMQAFGRLLRRALAL